MSDSDASSSGDEGNQVVVANGGAANNGGNANNGNGNRFQNRRPVVDIGRRMNEVRNAALSPFEGLVAFLRKELTYLRLDRNRFRRQFFRLKEMADRMRDMLDEAGINVPPNCDHRQGNEWNPRRPGGGGAAGAVV